VVLCFQGMFRVFSGYFRAERAVSVEFSGHSGHSGHFCLILEEGVISFLLFVSRFLYDFNLPRRVVD